MMKKIIPILGLLITCGCSFHKEFNGAGVDKLSTSVCARCNKPPFYVNGRFVRANNK